MSVQTFQVKTTYPKNLKAEKFSAAECFLIYKSNLENYPYSSTWICCFSTH